MNYDVSLNLPIAEEKIDPALAGRSPGNK